MSEQELDEFDTKAKKFLENGKKERLENILREFALCEGYENGLELENPERVLQKAGVEADRINHFTEYKVAKNQVKHQIKKELKSKKRGFKFLKSLE